MQRLIIIASVITAGAILIALAILLSRNDAGLPINIAPENPSGDLPASTDPSLSLYVHRIDNFPLNATWANLKKIDDPTLSKYPTLKNAIDNATSNESGISYTKKIDSSEARGVITNLGFAPSNFTNNASPFYSRLMLEYNQKAYDVSFSTVAILTVNKLDTLRPDAIVNNVTRQDLSQYPTLLQGMNKASQNDKATFSLDLDEARSAVKKFSFGGVPTTSESGPVYGTNFSYGGSYYQILIASREISDA